MDAAGVAPVSSGMNDTGRPVRWSEVRTGVLVLLGLVPLAAAVFFLDVLRRGLAEGPALVVVADEIQGLAPGADVWVAGSPAGRVRAISFLDAGSDDSGSIAVELVLLHSAGPMLRRDATARIGSGALLAPPVVKLDPGSPGSPPYDFEDTLFVAPTPDVEDFRSLADSARRAALELAGDIDRLDAIMRTGDGTVPRLRRDGALTDDLRRQRARLQALRAAWLEGAGLGAAWRDDALHAGASRIGTRVSQLEPAAVDSRLPEALGSLRARTRRLARRMDASEGTLGRMATDAELRLQIGRAQASMDSLMIEAAISPLQFLRFRLF